MGKLPLAPAVEAICATHHVVHKYLVNHKADHLVHTCHGDIPASAREMDLVPSIAQDIEYKGVTLATIPVDGRVHLKYH